MPDVVWRPVLSVPRWVSGCARESCDEPVAYVMSWPGRSRFLCTTHAGPLASERECPPLDWGDKEDET